MGLSSKNRTRKEKALPTGSAFFLVILTCVIFAPNSQAAAANAFSVNATPPPSIQAPADVYFGVYRLSNLSVRNAIHDMNIEGDSPLALPGQIERINAVQSALTDWELRYPHDPWLPGTMARFATFLIGKHVPQYDRVALGLLEELETLYPNTWYARFADQELRSFDVLPEFDLRDGPDVRRMPLIFESMTVGIGANLRRHFL